MFGEGAPSPLDLTESGSVVFPSAGGSTDVTIIARFGQNRKGENRTLEFGLPNPSFFKERVRKLIRPDSNRRHLLSESNALFR